MEPLNRGDKIYLDEKQKVESWVNNYLACRDGIVEVYEYNDSSGYGSKTRLFYCQNTKSEVESIIRQIWEPTANVWMEEDLAFDSDSFKFLRALLSGKKDEGGGKYTLVRDYGKAG